MGSFIFIISKWMIKWFLKNVTSTWSSRFFIRLNAPPLYFRSFSSHGISLNFLNCSDFVSMNIVTPSEIEKVITLILQKCFTYRSPSRHSALDIKANESILIEGRAVVLLNKVQNKNTVAISLLAKLLSRTEGLV